MTHTEALRLALEALKEIIHWYAVRDRNDVLLNFVDQNPEIKKAMKAITVIEAALEAKDEPIATKNNDGVTLHLGWDDLPVGTKLYATPPQRTWVGLTDDDRVLIKHDANYNQFMTAGEYAERVQLLTEARLKDKNT